jgi:hypothetical protein
MNKGKHWKVSKPRTPKMREERRRIMLKMWKNEDYRKSMSVKHKGQKNNKGKHWTIRDTSRMGGRSGSESPSWQGGKTIIDKLIRRMKEYSQWRSDVFQRDNWTCKTCGKNGCYVTVHHIKAFNKIIKENNIKNIKEARRCKELWNIGNGITLCEDCHKLADNYYRGRQRKNVKN